MNILDKIIYKEHRIRRGGKNITVKRNRLLNLRAKIILKWMCSCNAIRTGIYIGGRWVYVTDPFRFTYFDEEKKLISNMYHKKVFRTVFNKELLKESILIYNKGKQYGIKYNK